MVFGQLTNYRYNLICPNKYNLDIFGVIFACISGVIFISIFPSVSHIFTGILKPFVGSWGGGISSDTFAAKFANVNAIFHDIKSVSNKIKIGQVSYFQIYRNNLICPSKYNIVIFRHFCLHFMGHFHKHFASISMAVVNNIFKGILKPLVGIFRRIFSVIFEANLPNF